MSGWDLCAVVSIVCVDRRSAVVEIDWGCRASGGMGPLSTWVKGIYIRYVCAVCSVLDIVQRFQIGIGPEFGIVCVICHLYIRRYLVVV